VVDVVVAANLYKSITRVGEVKRINVMVDIILKTEGECELSDEPLKITAATVSDKANLTWGYCTANQSGCAG
jgi:hypothetical protein